MPGAPSSASTTRPESSAKAGSCAALAAAIALIAALARKVVPVSSGSSSPRSPAEIASTPCGASNSRISASLPGLWVAITSLPVICRCMRNSGDCNLLQVDEPRYALFRQRNQRQELAFGKRRLLRGALHLDDAAVAGHDEIGVGVGFRILGIVEIEHRRALIDTAGDRRDIVAQHLRLEHVARLHPADAVGQRHPGAGDGGGAGAAVGLDHVAIDRDLAFAERCEV